MNDFIKRVMIGGAIGAVFGFVKGTIKYFINRNKEKECADWWEAHKMKAGEDYLHSGFVTVDTERRMVIDGSTGEILEDFNKYPDPEGAMALYMKALWSCSIQDN